MKASECCLRRLRNCTSCSACKRSFFSAPFCDCKSKKVQVPVPPAGYGGRRRSKSGQAGGWVEGPLASCAELVVLHELLRKQGLYHQSHTCTHAHAPTPPPPPIPHAHTHTHLSTCTVCARKPICTRIHSRTHTHTQNTNTHTHTHAHAHTERHTHTDTYMHMHSQLFILANAAFEPRAIPTLGLSHTASQLCRPNEQNIRRDSYSL